MKATLVSALKISGELLLKYYDKPIKTAVKESQSSIVTEADTESDRMIMKIVREKFPMHNIISEESGFIDNKSEYTWVIDPLDGTSNFASGLPWFGVLISIFKKDIPIMGGAYLPVQDALYFAEQGKGAFKNEEALPLVKEKKLKDSLIAFCVDYPENTEALEMNIKLFKNVITGSRNLRSTNSLIDFIYIAEGKIGGLINLNTRVWDISVFTVILSETGVKLKQINGEDIHYKIDENIISRNFEIVAGTAPIIESLKYNCD